MAGREFESNNKLIPITFFYFISNLDLRSNCYQSHCINSGLISKSILVQNLHSPKKFSEKFFKFPISVAQYNKQVLIKMQGGT